MTDVRHARREFWLIAQNFIATLLNVFGAPEEIAERHTLLRREWTLMAKWLRAGEALLRQLLLIEAAALPKPEPRAIKKKSRARKPKTMSFDADAPDTWRVSFRCVLPMDRRRPRRPTPTHAGEAPAFHTRFLSAWPLAERAEALLRAFNDPLPYAKRLARRLAAAPALAAALLVCAPETPSLVGDADYAMVLPAAESAAERATDSS